VIRKSYGCWQGACAQASAVLSKFVVQLKIVCVDAISEPWLLILVVNVADVESRWLAHLISRKPPTLPLFSAHPPDAQLPLKAMKSNLVDTIGTSGEPHGRTT